MKRRRFLRLASASLAAPLLPALPAQAASVLTPKLKALGYVHAHRYPMVSVMGMTRRLGISQAEATELLSHLSREGLIAEAGLPSTGATSARSNVFRPFQNTAIGRTSSGRRVRPDPAPSRPDETAAAPKDCDDWLTHVRVIAVQNGHQLSGRVIRSLTV